MKPLTIKQSKHLYEFGPFRLDPEERLLLRNQELVTLTPKAFDTLVVLIENSGRLLEKDDLMRAVWPDTFVDENTLTSNISTLRKALGQRNGDQYIETIPKRGYRFVAEVRELQLEAGDLLLQKRTRSRLVIRNETEESDNEGEPLSARMKTRSRNVAAPKLRGLNSNALAAVALFGLLSISGIAYFLIPHYVNHASGSPPVSASELSKLRSSTAAPAAEEAYLKGRSFWNKRTPQDMREATKYFEQAIRIDPNYAQAYAGLADSYLLGGNEDEAAYSAKDLARKALSLDDTLAEAHTSLAYFLSALDWNWSEAETEFRRAIQLDPNYVTAHHWYAYHLASMGRLAEAKDEIKRAREIDPSSLIINTDLAHILYLQRNYTQAIIQCQRVVEMEPNFAAAHQLLAEACAQKDMFDEALAESQRASELGLDMKQLTAYVYAASGQREKAQQIIDELKEEVRRGELNEVGIAWTYAALGEQDLAFRWLEEGYRRRIGGLALLKVEPRFERLHTDPRFAELLRRMGFDQ
jgi:DNA-binding winged helix-turn-helix (wHTH) protein/Tfp pilus assembly protein PilF